MVELTEAEAAVYDRQLRVWGVETQKRLNAARILILGCTGLAAEVAKNIVLAGVGSLTLMDDSPCSTCPPGNFLVPADATPTQSVAEVSVQTLQEMNPLVKVEARKGSIASLQDRSLVKDYNVVLLIGPPSRLAQQLDEECSKHGVAFYVAASRGTTSYMFADLHTHTYGPMNVKEGQPVTTSTVQFTPLAKALFAPWRSLPPPIKRKHKLFFVLRVCAEFERKHRRFPSAKDLSTLAQLKQSVAEGEGQDAALVPDALLGEFASSSAELPPVNAVLGGILANEMLQAVSAKGEPMNNFFFFCLEDGSGLVEHVTG